MALRVPTFDIFVVDLTAEIEEETTWKRSAQRGNAMQRVTRKASSAMPTRLFFPPTSRPTPPPHLRFQGRHHAGLRLCEGCAPMRHKWGYPSRIADLIRRMAKEDSKAGSEAPAADEKDLSLSKLKNNQVTIEDNRVLHQCGFQRTTGQAGP